MGDQCKCSESYFWVSFISELPQLLNTWNIEKDTFISEIINVSGFAMHGVNNWHVTLIVVIELKYNWSMYHQKRNTIVIFIVNGHSIEVIIYPRITHAWHWMMHRCWNIALLVNGLGINQIAEARCHRRTSQSNVATWTIPGNEVQSFHRCLTRNGKENNIFLWWRASSIYQGGKSCRELPYVTSYEIIMFYS